MKYPGAKWNLAEWIISFFPPHTTYLEPFFGSGAIFFNKVPSKVETINDIDDRVVNLFKVLRDMPEKLTIAVELTPWSRTEYRNSYKQTGDPLEDARRFLVRCGQAFGSTTNSKPGWKNDVRGLPYSNCAKVWTYMPDRITQIAGRLRGVQIENEPATKIIDRYNHETVLIYADPPYPLETRSGKLYANEMTNEEHVELLNVLDDHCGPVILSGYACDLYDSRLKHWQRETQRAQAEKGKIREEFLWLNPVAAKQLEGRLFL